MPDEKESQWTLVEFVQNTLPGFALISGSVKEFEAKQAYPWHLSLLLQLVDCTADGLPRPAEQEILNDFEDVLADRQGSTALFLARITNNKTRELIWRIRDPEAANAVLTMVIQSRDHPRPFDCRIDPDPEWSKMQWLLKCLN